MSSDDSAEGETELYDVRDVDETDLTDTIVEYVRIDREDGIVITTTAFDTLSIEQQVLVVLIAEQIRTRQDLTSDPRLHPEEISHIADRPVSEMYPAIRELETDGVLRRNDRSYQVSPEKIEAVTDIIEAAQ